MKQWDAVLLLALKTHWTRAEIMALPAAEFNHYLDRLTRAYDE